MGVLLSLSSAKAGGNDWSPSIPPVKDSFELTAPHKVVVWEQLHFSGTLPDGRLASLYLGLACYSESDTSSGACPTKLNSWSGAYAKPASNVTLRFTNTTTHATVDLVVAGTWSGPSCVPGDSGNGFTSVVAACPYGWVVFTAYLSETELRKLPYGGVWVAHMGLRTLEWGSGSQLGEFTTDIELDVHGITAGIHIPNSTVKLPVTMGHSEPVTVDTCLYDGSLAGEHLSNRWELRLDDTSGAATESDFALKNVTKPDAHPLYYTVSAGTPGSGGSMQFLPGRPKVFTGMDKVSATGTMTIGGKTVPCVQWPLTLKLQPFNPVRQAMGQYQGQINLLFTPSLNMP